MNRKRKPPHAGRKTGVINSEQEYHTHTPDHFQCPCCKLTGGSDLFQPGWPDDSHELITRNPGLGITGYLAGMEYQGVRYMFSWLSRHGG